MARPDRDPDQIQHHKQRKQHQKEAGSKGCNPADTCCT